MLDYLVVPEARGFLLGAAISNKLNIGCIPVRKKEKLPPTTVEKQFEYEKEYGKDILELQKLVNEDYSGSRFYIIDDYLFMYSKKVKDIVKPYHLCRNTN